MPATYDVFISYAHADDADGWVGAFVEAICAEHAQFSATPLRVFFDRDSIRTMADWEASILIGLRESRLMLAMLSPAYFASAFCRREWEVWLDHERARALPGSGVAPVYTATHPDFEDEASAALDGWLADLRQRQHVDVRPWRPAGPEALQREEVRRRIQRLDQDLDTALQRSRRAAESPTTIPPHNPQFVGRRDELRRLHLALAAGRVGAITAIHGLGGVGKSALAFEYAHAFADHYPGGRLLVPCAGVADLRVPLVNLADTLGVRLSDDERMDLAAGFAKVRGALEGGERTLLLLDNIDDPALLAPARRAEQLPGGEQVHLLVTTRIEPDRLRGVDCIALDVLPEADALELLRRHRPFEEPGDEEAALAIVRRLGGHALAVEVVAVFLWQTPEVGYGAYLLRLEHEGLAALEGVARDDQVQLSRHQQAVLSELLEPTLARLSAAERLALEYAAVMPPDWVVLPWLRELVGEDHPQVAAEPQPGYPDPWRQVARRLTGLRLLEPGDDPRLVRMHRLVGAVVRADTPDPDARRKRLTELAQARAEALGQGWLEPENRWEAGPLKEYAEELLEVGAVEAGGDLACALHLPLEGLSRMTEARDLLQRALDACEADPPPDATRVGVHHHLASVERHLGHAVLAAELTRKALAIDEEADEPDRARLADGYNNLAVVEQDLGHHDIAHDLLQRAIAIGEEVLGPDHPNLAIRYNNLAVLTRDLGRSAEARELLQRAIAIEEGIYGAEHPELAIRYSNLASIEMDLGDLQASRELLLRAIAIEEKAYDAEHPYLALRYSNLAHVERDLGNLDRARELLQRAIAIEESVYDGEHPDLAIRFSNLAIVEQEAGDLDRAHALLERAIAIEERLFDSEHPNLAIRYSNLATVVHDQGDLDRAEALARRALAIYARHFAPDHPRAAVTRFRLGRIRYEQGHRDEGLAHARQAHHDLRVHRSPDSREVRVSTAWLAEHDPEAPAG